MILPARGRRFVRYASSGSAGLAGYYNVCHFQNPAGSGVDAYIYRIVIDSVKVVGTEKPYQLLMGRKDTLIGSAAADIPAYNTSSRSLNSYEGTTVSKCSTGSSAPGGVPAVEGINTDIPDVDMISIAMLFDTTQIVEFPEPIVLKPGTGWGAKCKNDIADIDMTIYWAEVPIT